MKIIKNMFTVGIIIRKVIMTETTASLKSYFVNKPKLVEKEKNPSGSKIIIF